MSTGLLIAIMKELTLKKMNTRALKIIISDNFKIRKNENVYSGEP